MIVPLACLMAILFATPAFASHDAPKAPKVPGIKKFEKIERQLGFNSRRPLRHWNPNACDTPSYAQIEFQRGLAAGRRAGWNDGYRAGMAFAQFCGIPPACPPGTSPHFQRGFHEGYRPAYTQGYRQAQRERSRRYRSWCW